MKNFYLTLGLILFIFLSQNTYSQTVTLGTGNIINGSTDYPTPYGNYYWGSKEQYLIKANELYGQGIYGGSLFELGFNVATVANVDLQGFTIKIGHYNDTTLHSIFMSNLTTVYSVGSYKEISGWNMHTFQSPFYWNGTDNLIVEVCFNNTSFTQNAQVYQTQFSNTMTLSYNTDASGVCSSQPTYLTPYTTRPNMKLSFIPPATNNLAMLQLVNPTPFVANSPNSNQPVTVMIKNRGTQTQTNFNIGYWIDNQTPVIENYSGSIAPNDTLIYSFVQKFNMTNGFYDIKTFVKNDSDSFIGDDTLATYFAACNPLTGNFTINNNGQADFNSISQAVGALNTCGIAGPVTFSIASGTYDEKIYIGPIPGASATNTIVFSSASGIKNDVVITNGNNSMDNDYTIQLNAASYITFKNLTIQSTSTSFNSVVKLYNGSNDNLFYNNNILTGSTSGSSKVIDIMESERNTIRKNTIQGGNMGINIFTNGQYTNIEDNTIDSNSITSFAYAGIYAMYQRRLTVVANDINSTSDQGDVMGINIYYCYDNTKLIGNRVYMKSKYTVYGVRFEYENQGSAYDTSFHWSMVANNMVTIETESNSVQAMRIYYSEKLKVYHNSIHVAGDNNNSTAFEVYGATQGDGIHVLNNIFSNQAYGKAAYYGNASIIPVCDYNNYYSKSSDLLNIQSSLGGLSTMMSFGRDSNSVSINPGFIADDNLHSTSLAMADKGTPLTEITQDIDGQLRSSQTPDIGADEYTPPMNNLTLINLYNQNPAISEQACNLSTAEVLVAEIINNGSATQTSFPISYKFNNNNIVTENWSGTLVSGDTLQYVFTTAIDFSQAGWQKLSVFTGLASDQNKNDDTLSFGFNTYKSITTIPFYDDFESRTNLYYHFSEVSQADATIDTIHGYNSESAIYMIGRDYYTSWNYTGDNILANISQNKEHLVKATLCPMDLSSYTNLRMSMKLYQSQSTGYSNFFYVTVNDSLFVKSLAGDSVWTNSDGLITLDLSPFTDADVVFSLCGILRTDQSYYGEIDDITIDDLRIYEPKPYDVGVFDVHSSANNRCGSVTDSLIVSIKNYGLNPMHSIPVVVSLDWGSNTYNYSATLTDTIDPEEYANLYMGTFNSTDNAQINLVAYTAVATDQDKTNDTLIAIGYNEVYKPIPFVENFESDDIDWEMYDFYVQDFSYIGQQGKGIVLEVYGGGYNMASNENSFEMPDEGNNSTANAIHQNLIGVIDSNSFLVYDYNMFQRTNYEDSIMFFIDASCGNDNWQVVEVLNNLKYAPINSWQKQHVSLAQYAGEKVQIALVKFPNSTNQSAYVIGFDNIGIVNATDFSLGNDTTLCFGTNYTIQTGLSSANGFKFKWTGPGTTLMDTLSSLTVSSAGTYTAEVTDSVGLTIFKSVNIGYHPQLDAYLTATDTNLCFGDSVMVNVNFSGQLPITFYWNDGASTYSDTAHNPMIFRYFGPQTSTEYILTTITDNNGCSKTINDKIQLVVNPLPTVTASGLASNYCTSDTIETLIGLPTGGVFMGNGITGTTFNPYLAGPGGHVIQYHYTDVNGCKNSDTMQTQVHANPVVGIVSNVKSIYCSNEPAEVFYAYPNGGTFSGASMTGNTFNPALANAGSNTIQYSYTDLNNCTSIDAVTFIVKAAPIINISTTLNSSYCSDDSPVALSATPSGGTFLGNGVSGNNFLPAQAVSGPAEIIYTFSDTTGCTSSDTISTIVNSVPNVVFTNSFASSYCKNGATVSLSGFPSGGVFSGNGVNGTIFYADSAVTGSNTISYTFTDGNGCSSTDNQNVTVNDMPIVTISTTLNSSYCVNDQAVTLSATPSGGTFTGDGVSGNVFTPANAGTGPVTIIYTYTNAGSCTSSDTISTIVYNQPTVVITNSFAAGYCQDGSTINLSGYPSGGSFSGSGVSGNVFSTSSASLGANTIYYTYTDVNGCANMDSATLTVNALPTVSVSTNADVCSSVNQIQLTGGTPTGGNYQGNAINSGSGIFFPSVAGVGQHSFDYSYTDANGCAATTTGSIRVVGQPTATFTIPGVVCKNDTAIVTYTGNASSAANFNWNFDNATLISGSNSGPYELSWSGAGIKALSLIVTDSGCVSTTVNQYTNVMDAIATISSVGSSTACFGDSVLLFANNGQGYSYLWFDTSGTLTSSNDTLPYFYAPATGIYFAQVTNDYGCTANSAQLGIEIYPELTSNFSIPTTACKDGMVPVNFTGQAGTGAVYNWNFGGGTIASGSGAGPYSIVWNTDSVKQVSLMVENYGCSSDITTKNVNIITTPATITALGSTTFCNGGSVTLYPNSGANLTYEWFKNGISTSNTNSYFTATQTGQYTVKVTNSLIGCENISQPVQVTVNTNNFNLAFTANNTTFTIPPFNVVITNQTLDTNNYYWAWSFGDGATSTVSNPHHQYQYDGTYTIGVIAQNINTGCIDTLVKNNYISCTGAGSNPCTLVASITPAGPKTICPTDSIKLTAANNPGANYQWLKDGVLIPGADSIIYWAKQTGNYQIMVSDTSCTQLSNPFSLSTYSTINPVIASSGSIMPCTNDSMELYVTTTFNSYLWSNGASTASNFIKTSGDYTVTVTDANGCQTHSAPYIVNASLLPTPEICIVGVDSVSNSNYIVWERDANPLIDSFRVYRESTIAGVYNLIGSKSVNDPGIFHDYNSNPMQKAYRYKITAVDSCGMETPPSNFHKTIHLSINAGTNGSWNLIWSHYVGFNFGSYRIYRGYDSTALQPLTQIQSTLNSYTDLNPPSGNIYYQIEVVSPHPCYPDSIYSKANTNYNTSRSNHMNTSAVPPYGLNEQSITDFSVRLYPNPNNGVFDLVLFSSTNDKYQISILNVLGQEVYKSEEFQAHGMIQRSLNLNNPAKGVYYISVSTKDQRLVKKMIIN